jgi:hypothetical protein
MGVITKSVEVEKDLTLFTVTGETDAEQILSQILALLKEEPTRLVLWDIRAGDLSGVSNSDLKAIVHSARPFADSRKGGRIAIVCSRDIDYGLGRMLQTFAELLQAPFEILVSRNMEEARQWLDDAGKE